MKKKLVRKFADFGLKYFPGAFGGLKKKMSESGVGIFFETYVGRMLMYAFFTFVISLFYLIITLIVFGTPILLSILLSFGISILSAAVIMAVFYYYPRQMMQIKKRSIEANIPFAANHMAAIAASGVPPHAMFRLLVDAEEYGEIANQAKKIVRNVQVFGMDVSSAIREVAIRSPSEDFREFLNGIVSTITTGGDLKKYLENAAESAMLDYKLKREKYIENLSTFADVYVGVLIAAPMFFISMLSLMALVGGSLFGFSIPLLINLGVYFMIPLLNVFFIVFVHLTQPVV